MRIIIGSVSLKERATILKIVKLPSRLNFFTQFVGVLEKWNFGKRRFNKTPSVDKYYYRVRPLRFYYKSLGIRIFSV